MSEHQLADYSLNPIEYWFVLADVKRMVDEHRRFVEVGLGNKLVRRK